MKQYIRKADIILFIVLVVIGLAASAAPSFSRSDASAGAKVIIESGGDLFAKYPLSEDRVIVVPAPKQVRVDAPAADQDDPGANQGDTNSSQGTPAADQDDSASAQYDYYNVVTVSGGTVSVTEASCKNQVCVRHGAISRSGESIVCLPNRLVVRIENGSGEGGGYDSVTS